MLQGYSGIKQSKEKHSGKLEKLTLKADEVGTKKRGRKDKDRDNVGGGGGGEEIFKIIEKAKKVKEKVLTVKNLQQDSFKGKEGGSHCKEGRRLEG